MTLADGETAAERRSPSGLKASLSSFTKAAKFALSETGPALQSTLKVKCYIQFKESKCNKLLLRYKNIICRKPLQVIT